MVSNFLMLSFSCNLKAYMSAVFTGGTMTSLSQNFKPRYLENGKSNSKNLKSSDPNF